jgi:hypothetical protein
LLSNLLILTELVKYLKKIKPHSQIASEAILGIVKSFRFNSQNYIPKEGLSFSLFRVEILSGLTVALAFQKPLPLRLLQELHLYLAFMQLSLLV